jgi:flagellar FliL protein
MATTEAPTDQLAEAPAGSNKLLIIAFVALVVISNITWGAVFFMTGGANGADAPADKPAAEEEEQAAAAPTEELGPLVEMKPLVVNLADAGGTRYLRVGMTIELRSEKDRELLEPRMVPLRDAFLSRLSGLESTDIIDSEDKDRIREQLLAEAKSIVAERAIQRVYFTEFMMQ